jgi:Ca-activated chloride channel family protein
MKNLFRWGLAGVILLALTACGPSAAKYNNEGNEKFTAQEFEAALGDYTTAELENPDLAEPYYNAGNTYYRQENLEKAEAQLNQSLRTAPDELAQQGYYNLGNTAYLAENWEQAIEQYKESLLINPADMDAKNNLELALKQQQQEQEQQQEQQNQGGGGQQNEEPQDQPDQGESDQNQDQGGGQPEQDDQQNQGGQGDQPQDQGGGGGQNQPNPGGGSRGGLTPEEAEQLLDALGQNSQTLQERLGQQHPSQLPPSGQDW